MATTQELPSKLTKQQLVQSRINNKMKVQVTNSLDKTAYPDLTIGNVYRVLGIEADDFRIINDDGLPYLYPLALFTIVDKNEPDDWIVEYGADGERYAYPPKLNRVGFFEDFFDDDPQTILTFHQYLGKQRIVRGATLSKAA